MENTACVRRQLLLQATKGRDLPGSIPGSVADAHRAATGDEVTTGLFRPSRPMAHDVVLPNRETPMAPPTIRVHHLNNSRSQRVLWLLEELGQPYEVVRYQRDAKTMLAPDALRAVHPLGKSPVVELDGRMLVESGAIIEALVERFDPGHALSPAAGDEDGRLRYRQWLHYAEGSAMPPLLMTLVFARIRSAPMPFFVRPVARRIADTAMKSFVGPQLATHLGYVERELGAHAWFAGDRFTAADIQMSFPLEAAVARAGDHVGPNIRGFVERIRSRPAYRRALEAGGPYELGR